MRTTGGQGGKERERDISCSSHRKWEQKLKMLGKRHSQKKAHKRLSHPAGKV
jgi:hypothetical protein